MEHMQEAYEKLVGKLKRKIEELECRYQKEVNENIIVRRMLIQKIVDLSSKDEAVATAEQIDEAIGEPGWYADLVREDWRE